MSKSAILRARDKTGEACVPARRRLRLRDIFAASHGVPRFALAGRMAPAYHRGEVEERAAAQQQRMKKTPDASCGPSQRPIAMVRTPHSVARSSPFWLEATFWMVLFLSLLHVAGTWGWIDRGFAGDYGSWLHTIERCAGGETPYLDFYAPYPPAMYWLLGGIAGLFGAGLVVMWSATSALFVLVCVLFWAYARAIAPPYLRAAFVVAGLLIATAYACLDSAPLPMGMYTPAAPLAIAGLLAAVVCALRVLRRGTLAAAIGLGAAALGCLLAKQDAWLPAGYLLAATPLVAAASGHPRALRSSLVAILACGVLVCTAAFALWMHVGWSGLARALLPPGQIGAGIARAMPSWQQLVVQTGAAGIAVAIASVSLLVARIGNRALLVRWSLASCLVALLACGIHVLAAWWIASGTGQSRGNGAEQALTTLLLHPSDSSAAAIERGFFSYLGALLGSGLSPLCLLVLAAALGRWWGACLPGEGRRLVLLLLGFCLCARFRRGCERMEWYHALFELPLYALSVRLVPGALEARRLVALAASLGLVLVAFGAYAYRAIGTGVATRGTWRLVPIETAAGKARVRRSRAREFHWLKGELDRRDPGRVRSLFQYGRTAGFNYYLGRSNPTSSTQGFTRSYAGGEAVLAELRGAPNDPFVLDFTGYLLGRVPEPGLHLGRWSKLSVLDIYAGGPERRLFEEILASCTLLSSTAGFEEPHFALYDCRFDPDAR